MELSTDYEHILAGGGEMGRLMREHDWAQTPLGPVSGWPQSLRTAVSICLASHFPMLIWWGPELVKLYNDAYRPMLGTKHPQALGQRGKDCWPEIWDIIGPMLEGVLSRGEATWSENQLLLLERNGYPEECYFTFSYSPIRIESGGIGGVFTAVTETTRQVVSERRLRTLRALSVTIVEAQTPEEVCQCAAQTLAENPTDLPFALLYMLTPDGTQARLTATASGSFAPHAAPALITLADEETRWPLGRVAVTGRPVLVEDLHVESQVAALSPDPLPAPHSALVLPMARAGEEHPRGFLIAGLSPRRPLDEEYQGFLLLLVEQIAAALDSARVYQDAKARAQALAELDRAKTAFFSNISHEFRTPLALSLGPLEALLADVQSPLAEEHRTQVEMVRRNALRQLKLVNTLLDFARIEAGRAEAAYLPTDLAQLTADLAGTFRAAIEKAGLRFLVDCPPLPEPIFVDRDMWEKIVLNLLSNAFKFTFAGYIRVALHPSEGGIELVVQDTGVGIRAQDLPHIFERFYQVHATQARTMEGSGIGLALVQELVRLHAGSMTVQSEEGVGTTFTLRLSSGKSHLPAEHVGTTPVLSSTALGADPYVEEALRWLPEYLAEGVAETMPDALMSGTPLPVQQAKEEDVAKRPGRLLVVDDNADMRAYLKRLLSPFYQILLAADGNTALGLARGTRPDLIITDVMMPGLDGFALLKALRATPITAVIPVILLSARAGDEVKLEGLHEGANDYLIKPFSARELLARVHLWLEIAHLRQEAELARQHLHDLLIQAPAVICVLRGPEHVYELANALYYQQVGPRELLGKPIREALPELEGQGIYELLAQVYATGEPFIGTEIRVELDRKNTGQGEETYFNFVYQPIRTSMGEVEGIMVHGVDVTEQVYARQRMQAFLGIASHELKNPLTSIKGNVEISRRRVNSTLQHLSGDAETLRATLESISQMLFRANQQIDLQNRLVSDLVDTTRIQAGKWELHLARADLNQLVREAVEEQRRLTPTRTILCDLAAADPLFLTMDADRIGQVISNYLSNALKYSERDQPVSVLVKASATEVCVAVRDRGAGLGADEQEHVWERFYRAPGVQVKSGTGVGLGLGLHICRTIIEEHGGRVGVESVKGEGSTFWFTLSLLDAPVG